MSSWGIVFDLTKDDMEALKEALNDMKNPVDLLFFTGEFCETCSTTEKILHALRYASPEIKGQKLIKIHTFNSKNDKELFRKYRVYRVPSVLLLDGVIRYTGTPAGEEIKSIVETIIRISIGESGLSNITKKKISHITKPIYIEVIVTPQCPYCPYAALLSNMFAFESYKSGNKAIISDIIEAYENTDIADKYGVMTVPVIVINGRPEFIGVPYEDQLLKAIIDASHRAK